MRTALVVVHASAGVGGLITGVASLTPPALIDDRRWLRRIYLTCVAVLLASMVVLVTIDWDDLEAGGRVAFAALIGLGVIIGYRLAWAQSGGTRDDERAPAHRGRALRGLGEGAASEQYPPGEAKLEGDPAHRAQESRSGRRTRDEGRVNDLRGCPRRRPGDV